MKNASLMLLCCILLVILLSLFTYSQRNYNNTKIIDKKIISVYNTKENRILKMSLEEYVWRVVAKEMPLSFHDEALKAQMVVARTYALKKSTSKTHENDADVCTDHNHCTAFLISNDYDKKLVYLEKTTKDQILTYDNQPILAVFHATSSGVTEKSSDIWQNQLPYLINVDSRVDEHVNGFYSEQIFSEEELKKLLSVENPLEFKDVILTDAGSVKSINVCGKIYSGTEIRNLLGLRSNNFTIKNDNDIYTFSVKGYGHGVGMSQTGANEYAKQGLNYAEILKKYYPGTEIKNYYELSNPTK